MDGKFSRPRAGQKAANPRMHYTASGADSQRPIAVSACPDCRPEECVPLWRAVRLSPTISECPMSQALAAVHVEKVEDFGDSLKNWLMCNEPWAPRCTSKDDWSTDQCLLILRPSASSPHSNTVPWARAAPFWPHCQLRAPRRIWRWACRREMLCPDEQNEKGRVQYAGRQICRFPRAHIDMCV